MTARAWCVGDRAMWLGYDMPTGATSNPPPPGREPTATDRQRWARLRHRMPVTVSQVDEGGIPRCAIAGDGFSFDPSVDIRRLEAREQPPLSVAVSFDRPPREDYVRVTVEHSGWTIEPAVEWREGDAFADVAEWLELCATLQGSSDRDMMATAHLIGRRIAEYWPGRAYFVEVWQSGSRGFAQTFQPFGVPRNAPLR